MTTTFENAKVGDRVYSLVLGRHLEIIRIDDNYCLPIVLSAGNTHYHIGYDGCGANGKVVGQMYFWDKPEIIAPTKPEHKREAPPVDTLVEVKGVYDSWIKRYSAGRISSGGYLACWNDGKTSRTADGDTSEWKEWRIPNDGWIEWHGGKMPVANMTKVDVRHRNGKEYLNQDAWDDLFDSSVSRRPDVESYASVAFWLNNGLDNDIIAYRLSKPD